MAGRRAGRRAASASTGPTGRCGSCFRLLATGALRADAGDGPQAAAARAARRRRPFTGDAGAARLGLAARRCASRPGGSSRTTRPSAPSFRSPPRSWGTRDGCSTTAWPPWASTSRSASRRSRQRGQGAAARSATGRSRRIRLRDAEDAPPAGAGAAPPPGRGARPRRWLPGSAPAAARPTRSCAGWCEESRCSTRRGAGRSGQRIDDIRDSLRRRRRNAACSTSPAAGSAPAAAGSAALAGPEPARLSAPATVQVPSCAGAARGAAPLRGGADRTRAAGRPRSSPTSSTRWNMQQGRGTPDLHLADGALAGRALGGGRPPPAADGVPRRRQVDAGRPVLRLAARPGPGPARAGALGRGRPRHQDDPQRAPGASSATR